MQRYFADSKITTEYQLTPEIYKHFENESWRYF